MKKNLYSGKFIVFEGLDGSGQSTQAGMLRDWIRKDLQKSVHLTKEPTNGIIGGLVRGQLTGDWKSGPECLQLLFAADRAHHLEKEMIPLLEKGNQVISDRYFLSTVAYGASAKEDLEWFLEINKPFLLPDITFLIKVSPKECISRINKDRFNVELFEKEKTLARVWKNYEKLASMFEDVHIVDGERPVEEVFREIKGLALSKLNI